MTAPVTDTPSTGDLLDSIAADATAATLAEIGNVAQSDDTPRDEKGRFAKRSTDDEHDDTTADDAPAAADPADAPDDTATDAAEDSDSTTPEAVPLPEGLVAVPKPERELATTFAVLDKDGELEVPDLQIRFTANGKERVEPLDKVVKLAQFGVYNHDKEQQTQQQITAAREAISYAQQVERQMAEVRAYVDRILTDDNAYLAARADAEARNTPEARAQRTLQEAQAIRQQAELQQVAQMGERFFGGSVQPAIEQISKALPTVSVEEIAAKVLLTIEPYKRNGFVPPQSYDAVAQAIVNDVVPWAQMIHEDRHAATARREREVQATKAAAEQKVQKATVESQKAKNLATKVVKPIGKTMKDAPKPRVIKTVDDAMEAAVQDALSATLTGA